MPKYPTNLEVAMKNIRSVFEKHNIFVVIWTYDIFLKSLVAIKKMHD